MNNPVFAVSDKRWGAPAFDKIKESDYLPAFREAMKEAYAEVDAIAGNPEEPTFWNTVEALHFSGEKLDTVSGIFFNLNECLASDKMQAIAEEISPELTKLSLYISLNDKLFRRIKTVWEKRRSLGLDIEEARLLDKSYKGFLESGANLPEDKKRELSEAAEQLSLLSLSFGKNVLDATNDFILHITDRADLLSLPEYAIAAAESEAAERGLQGWVFTLQAPSLTTFLKYSGRRELREKIWRASSSRCVGGKYDNTGIIRKILSLRLKTANILGWKNYAAFALRNRMAKNTRNVNSFLKELLGRSLPYGKRDVARVEAFARKTLKDGSFRLMPWDFAYWTEKYRARIYNINDTLLKPYFRLENVQKALFLLAEKLYGLRFEEAADIPVYHKDVKVFEVKDRTGRDMALFYSDFYPRPSKRGGAWMTSFREQGRNGAGREVRPLVSIVCNFTKPVGDEPSLLTFGEVTTILHEFGHALNGILAEGKYSSMTGTNVARDFVELPSQIMENFATEKEFLKLWAKHYKTGEDIPEALIKKIIRARNFNSGYACVRQLMFGITDMALHTLGEIPEGDILGLERKARKKCDILPYVEGTAFIPSFTHIFAGGYSAGYYSYKWAEVLEADAFELFRQKGIFSAEVAESFRRNILSRGNIEDADVLYRRFRGRDPEIDALMKSQGMGRRLKG